MSKKKTLEERRAEYVALSIDADSAAISADFKKTHRLLGELEEKAAKAGDEDFRLFAQAEQQYFYLESDYESAITMLNQAFIWQIDKGLPPVPYLYACYGVYFSKLGRDEEAINWYEKALDINSSLFNALRQKGISLSRLNRGEEAIVWFDKALALTSDDYGALHGKGVALYNLGRVEKGFSWIRKAAKINPGKCESDFRFFCASLGKDFEEEWKKLEVGGASGSVGKEEKDAEAPQDKAKVDDDHAELQGLITQIRESYKDKWEDFIEKQKAGKETLERFLEGESLLDSERSLFLLLRKWNSYTPTLPAAEDERSKGGGYFIRHKKIGVVVDPGYNFIENFAEAGGRICDIDAIVMTHAHNDHTADFESLLTLLYKYNNKVKKDNKKAKDEATEKEEKPPEKREKKQVRIYLNNGAFKKVSGLLPLRGNDHIEVVHTLNVGNKYDLGGGIMLTVLPAYHDEILARNQAVGLLFTFDKKRTILFTGDTGLFPLKADTPELEPDTDRAELWESYGNYLPKKRIDLLVAHIGAIADKELDAGVNPTPGEVCYPNHLGIIGTACMITKLEPTLAVVSEFGEEMKDFRCPLIEGLQEKVIDGHFKKKKEADPDFKVPRVVPGDIYFIYDIVERKFYCSASHGWKDVADITFDAFTGTELRCNGEREPIVFYLDKSTVKDSRKTLEKVIAFCDDRKYKRKIYFSKT